MKIELFMYSGEKRVIHNVWRVEFIQHYKFTEIFIFYDRLECKRFLKEDIIKIVYR